jgi:hypothetical protein
VVLFKQQHNIKIRAEKIKDNLLGFDLSSKAVSKTHHLEIAYKFTKVLMNNNCLCPFHFKSQSLWHKVKGRDAKVGVSITFD